MTTFLQQLILGLRGGSLIALVALGIVMIFKTTGVVNFAYGYMGMFSIYIAYTFLNTVGAPLWLSVTICIGFAFALGATAERGLLRQVRHLSKGAMLILTLGMLMIFEGLALQIWKQDYRSFPNLVSGVRIITIDTGRLVIRNQDILIFIVAAAIMAGLFIYFKYTKTGLAIRATAQNEDAAKLMGIKVGVIFALSWGVGVSLGAVSAVLAAPRTFIHPNMMLPLQIRGLTGAVLGGFDSLPGAVVGGILLGVIEQFMGAYISEELKMALSLLIILVVLLVKPSGLMGSKAIERV